MTTNGQPKIEIMGTPLQCLVCEKEIRPGEKVIVSMPDKIFIHMDCVENVDQAKELIRQHRETGGE